MQKQRIGFLDFLRGFALFGILAVNLPYFAKPMVVVGSLEENQTLLDEIASWIVAFFFESKFYILFSFLFGYGVALQAQEWKDSSASGRYFRRMFGLLLLGILHSTFLFLGDILVSYAILGSLSWLFRNKSGSWLYRFSLLCLFIGIFFRMVLVYGHDEFQAKIAESLPEIIARSKTGYLGTFWDSVKQRSEDTLISYPFTILFQWPSVLAMFSVGMAAAKSSLLQNWESSRTELRKLFFWFFPFGILGNFVYLANSRHLFISNFPLQWKIWFTVVETLSAPALCFCYVYLLGLFYHSARSTGDRIWFESAGNFSLSNYLGESLVCSCLFCGWGFGFYDRIGNFVLLLLVPPIWGVCLLYSYVWRKFSFFGPAEILLRILTYGKRIKILRP
ncbi:DUF418 domain-containing protein [Leptospira fluminis]|uniref:DUF418 domain-containing protein n=1 Tax=Leptospira fluminis TaxID=2484979 RepID=A0A4R9GP63_9LEPT|nr:DUF418 domain-containing protein [Leptospira fluminis]TGK18757.1 DUF418 domain-containing protein [Leptospira fluminis]